MRNVHIWYINQDFHLISHTKKLNKLVISGTFTSLYLKISQGLGRLLINPDLIG